MDSLDFRMKEQQSLLSKLIPAHFNFWEAAIGTRSQYFSSYLSELQK
jgi:hypothetical protein